MADPVPRSAWPAWYRRFHERGSPAAHRRLSRVLLTANWLAARTLGWTVRTNGTGWLRLDSRRGNLVLATHRSLFDSWIIGTTFLGFRQLSRLLRNRLDKVLWHLPEMENFEFTWLTHLLIEHLNCVPVQRGNRHQQLQVIRRIKRGLAAGQSIELFPTAGRERRGQPLAIDPEMVKVILWYCRGTSVNVITVRIDGVPVWRGEKMGGDKSSKLRQFWLTYWHQIFGRLIYVHYERFPIGRYLEREETPELYRELAAAISAAITPQHPRNPLPASSVVAHQQNSSA